MTIAKIRTVTRSSAALAATCCVMLAAVDPAAARDDGVLQFFSSVFGGAGASSSQVAPSGENIESPRQGRPLTVRPRRIPRLAVAAVPIKPEKVAILEDRTLRRGDAVMTAGGLRIFVGSTSGLHTKDDFIDLAKSGHEVTTTTEKVLADLNRRPGR